MLGDLQANSLTDLLGINWAQLSPSRPGASYGSQPSKALGLSRNIAIVMSYQLPLTLKKMGLTLLTY